MTFEVGKEYISYVRDITIKVTEVSDNTITYVVTSGINPIYPIGGTFISPKASELVSTLKPLDSTESTKAPVPITKYDYFRILRTNGYFGEFVDALKEVYNRVQIEATDGYWLFTCERLEKE